MMSVKKILLKVRDVIWPIEHQLDATTKEVNTINVDDCVAPINTIDTEINIVSEYFNYEYYRKSRAENMAMFFLSISTLATLIMMFLLKELVFNCWAYDWVLYENYIQHILVMFTFLSVVYFIGSIVYSLKVLSKGAYNIVGCPDYVWKARLSDDYIRRLFFASKYNAIQLNKKHVDRKFANVELSQGYFKRAIIAVAVVIVCLISLI